MICPISRTALILIPAFVEATLTDEQTSSVFAKTSGIELIKTLSAFIKPFCTRAVKPPIKFIPMSLAALSRACANIR